MAKKIAAYQAEDGTVFPTKEQAEEHDVIAKRGQFAKDFAVEFSVFFATNHPSIPINAEALAQDLSEFIFDRSSILVAALGAGQGATRKRRSKAEMAAANADGQQQPDQQQQGQQAGGTAGEDVAPAQAVESGAGTPAPGDAHED